MDWNKPWKEEELRRGYEKKWNAILMESLKMALLLPLIILGIEALFLHGWQELFSDLPNLLFDYLFMFSVIFLVFALLHLLLWNRQPKK